MLAKTVPNESEEEETFNFALVLLGKASGLDGGDEPKMSEGILKRLSGIPQRYQTVIDIMGDSKKGKDIKQRLTGEPWVSTKAYF